MLLRSPSGLFSAEETSSGDTDITRSGNWPSELTPPGPRLAAASGEGGMIGTTTRKEIQLLRGVNHSLDEAAELAREPCGSAVRAEAEATIEHVKQRSVASPSKGRLVTGFEGLPGQFGPRLPIARGGQSDKELTQ